MCNENVYLPPLMKAIFNKLLLFILIIFVMSGCSEYQKVLKSSDINLKYDKALEYFEDGEYYKAYPLFEELIAVYRGTEKAENLSYTYAYCDYYLLDYILAAHRFEQFVKTYPLSKHAEECQFMIGYCNFLNSPKPSLDQTNTYIAIDQLQLFTNLYPKSELIDSCNTLIDGMLMKLSTKNFDRAVLYLNTGNYKASVVTFKNFLEKFPDTDFREEAEFRIFEASYELAKNSVSSKKSERIEESIKAYVNFVDSFPKSTFLKKAESMYLLILREKEKSNEQKS